MADHSPEEEKVETSITLPASLLERVRAQYPGKLADPERLRAAIEDGVEFREAAEVTIVRDRADSD